MVYNGVLCWKKMESFKLMIWKDLYPLLHELKKNKTLNSIIVCSYLIKREEMFMYKFFFGRVRRKLITMVAWEGEN